MIQLCQQRRAGLNPSPDQWGGIQQITRLQINHSGSVRSFAARVVSHIHSPERAIWAENVFRRDLITLKIPWQAYPRECPGWSCCSSRSRAEGWMFAAELCPLVGTARRSSTACAEGISFQWNWEGFIWMWMCNSHSLLMSASPWSETCPGQLYSSSE